VGSERELNTALGRNELQPQMTHRTIVLATCHFEIFCLFWLWKAGRPLPAGRKTQGAGEAATPKHWFPSFTL